MRKFALISIVALFAVLGGTAGATTSEEADYYYSIQVRAVPMAEKADGMATYRKLRDKGYLVYTSNATIDGKPWLRVAVGVFINADAAATFGKSFSAKEKQDYFVARVMAMTTAADGGDFVVTPSALWTREGGRNREVLVFDDPAPTPGQIRLNLSRDRKTGAFQYGARVYTVRLGDDEARLLFTGGDSFSDKFFKGPTPYWSPSGRYLAFQDSREPGSRTSLWVIPAEGGELRALVDNRSAESNSAAKWFAWHRAEDRIFFIDGYARSPYSIGGSIRSVDLDGNVKTVLEHDKKVRQEFTGPLRVDSRYLRYRRVQFDKNYDRRTISHRRIPLSDL